MITLRPAQAIAWEIWARHRLLVFAIVGVLLTAGVVNWSVVRGSEWEMFGRNLGFVLLTVVMFATFGVFHFTEGQRKGGFGRFPGRMFTLPISTRALVAWPMIYGVLGVVLVYLFSVVTVFRPLGVDALIVLPSLYLACALTGFQAVVWTIPEHRYLKLFLLSCFVTVLAIGWMFFHPNIIAGTLIEWGYTGDPNWFEFWLYSALIAVVPGCFAISWYRIHQQRQGGDGRTGWISRIRVRIAECFFVRRKPFTSAASAAFWLGWRQYGLILPTGVSILLLLTLIPTYLSRPLSPEDTMIVFGSTSLTPLILALLIGRGFGKPDFWKSDLSISPFHTVRPFGCGDWVIARMQVAALSVLLSWGIGLVTMFFWTVHAGNFSGIDGFLMQYRGYLRTDFERVVVPVLVILTTLIITWRFLISGLPSGLSGHRLWFFGSNTLYLAVFATVVALFVYSAGNEDHELRLYNVWPWVMKLPILLLLACALKFSLCYFVWRRVHRLGLLSERKIYLYFMCWTVGTLLVVGCAWYTAPDAQWIKSIALLLALLSFPIVSPGAAMLSMANNRTRS